MTTFDLEITQVQLKNHTKSHESKLRISDPEWYRIYVQMSGPQHRRCRRLCVTHRCRHPYVTCHCHHRRTRIAVIAHTSLAAAVVIAVAVVAACRSLLGGHCCCHCHCCRCRCRQHCCRRYAGQFHCHLSVCVWG